MRPLRRCGGRHPIMRRDPPAQTPTRPRPADRTERAGRHRCSTADLRKLLIAQIGNELGGAPAVHRHRAVLRAPEPASGGASSSATSRVEEAQHAAKIMDFLTRQRRSSSTCRRSRLSRPGYESALREPRPSSASSRSEHERQPHSSTAMAAVAAARPDDQLRGHQFLAVVRSRSRSRRKRKLPARSSTSSTAASTCSRPRRVELDHRPARPSRAERRVDTRRRRSAHSVHA